MFLQSHIESNIHVNVTLRSRLTNTPDGKAQELNDFQCQHDP